MPRTRRVNGKAVTADGLKIRPTSSRPIADRDLSDGGAADGLPRPGGREQPDTATRADLDRSREGGPAAGTLPGRTRRGNDRRRARLRCGRVFTLAQQAVSRGLGDRRGCRAGDLDLLSARGTGNAATCPPLIGANPVAGGASEMDDHGSSSGFPRESRGKRGTIPRRLRGLPVEERGKERESTGNRSGLWRPLCGHGDPARQARSTRARRPAPGGRGGGSGARGTHGRWGPRRAARGIARPH